MGWRGVGWDGGVWVGMTRCLPSLFIAAPVDYVRVMRVLPLGVDKTEIHAEWQYSASNMLILF